MIRRQWLKVDADVLSEIAAALQLDAGRVNEAAKTVFSEPLFELLGAKTVHSIDFFGVEQRLISTT